MQIEPLSWDEAEKVLARAPLVLIPLGARSKEHGLHLPLENDYILARELAARVGWRIEVPCLAPVPFHYYPAFADYPGSISLRLETARDLMVDICRSLAAHGPRRFYVLNTGVSTVRALEPAREILAREGIAMGFTDLLAVLGPVERRIGQQPRGTHADEMETSMMLHLAPHLVRMERAVPELSEASGPGPLTRAAREGGVHSPTGAWGDPTLATADKGRILVEALVTAIVAEIEALTSAC
jgi:creatinine amidohydrolase